MYVIFSLVIIYYIVRNNSFLEEKTKKIYKREMPKNNKNNEIYVPVGVLP